MFVGKMIDLRLDLRPRRYARKAIRRTPTTAPMPMPAFAPVERPGLGISGVDTELAVGPPPVSVCCGGRLNGEVDVIKVLDTRTGGPAIGEGCRMGVPIAVPGEAVFGRGHPSPAGLHCGVFVTTSISRLLTKYTPGRTGGKRC